MFVVDAVVDPDEIDPDDREAPYHAQHRAAALAKALNIALYNDDWLGDYLSAFRRE